MFFPAGILALAALSRVHAATTSASSATVTALSDCHLHDLVQYCIPLPSGDEIAITTASSAAAATALPDEYLDCHSHGAEMYCIDGSSNEEVQIAALSTASTDEDHDDHDEDDHDAEEEASESAEAASSTQGQNCHFHAGVEHCTGGNAAEITCEKVDREYNVPLRIGSIFIVLVTSAISVFLPLLLNRFTKMTGTHIVFTIIKQFGTGVIVSTAFIHLLSHAEMMFSNPCVGELKYEATATSIAMAGLMVAFCVEFAGHRFIDNRALLHSSAAANSSEEVASSGSSHTTDKEAPVQMTSLGHGGPQTDDHLSVFVMEMGIIFHSILIGITLVVAGDSGFPTLLVVIIFHQGFEGLALGTRIGALSPTQSLTKMKLALASLFCIITPIGMAIGIGVSDYFNGSDKSTLIALGTLDAFSAGILVWVGVVEMWAGDWMTGDLRTSSLGRVSVAFLSLICGMVLMSLLGKWA